MRFRNREQAAQLLIERLAPYRGHHPLVLAIPRGAVPIGKRIADALDGQLDVVLVHKLRAPENPQLAIGAVDETGHTYIAAYAQDMGLSAASIATEREKQLAMLRTRRAQYTPRRPPLDPSGRLVVVVDDGIATGSSMMAALRAVRAKNPAKLVAAAAVAQPEILKRIRMEADEVVCLYTPDMLYAVGQCFQDFPQVTDEEAIGILQQCSAPSREHETEQSFSPLSEQED